MTGPAYTSDAPLPTDYSSFVQALEERRRRVYDYLDSWPGASSFRPIDIHDAIYSYVRRRGKALRPLLLFMCCGAVGGDEDQALPAAAAVEVFHTWTLVHDDIIDRDDTRRGSPTVHAEYAAHARDVYTLDARESAHYGLAVAVLAGDLQQSWAYGLLTDLVTKGVDAGIVLEIVGRMSRSLTPSLLEGEMLDVQYSLSSFESLTEDDVLAMLSKKTGALLEFAAWCGARIGIGNRQDTEHWADKLAKFALLCGTAFQLQDDLLGLTSDESILGKPVGSDLREGKRTLLVYRALARAGRSDRDLLLSVLGDPNAKSEDIREALDIVRSTGASSYVSELAKSLIGQASALLHEVPPSQYRDMLGLWAHFVLERTH